MAVVSKGFILALKDVQSRTPEGMAGISAEVAVAHLHSSSAGAQAGAGIDPSLDSSAVVASKEQQTGVSCSFLPLKAETSAPAQADGRA